MLWAFALVGCTTKALPPRARVVERVDIIGPSRLSSREAASKIATHETQRILAGSLAGLPVLGILDRLTVEYATFDREVLQRDLDRLRRYYRARGFYDTQVQAARVVRMDNGKLRVEIEVVEGAPTHIGAVVLDFPSWEEALSANEALHRIISRYKSEPVEDGEERPRFDEDRYDTVKRSLLTAMTDHGYAYAEVSGTVEVDVIGHSANVGFSVTAGPHCTFGPITIEGLGELPDAPIRKALGFEPGDPFSTAKIASAEHALVDFGVFGTVQIIPVKSRPGDARKEALLPVRVVVSPVDLRGVHFGIGAAIGSQLEAHVLAGWESRNFLGGLRRLTLQARPGIVLFPTRLSDLGAPTKVLPEIRIQQHFTQPGFPEARSNTHIAAGAKIYSPDSVALPDPIPEDYNILGYQEIDGSAGVDRRFRFPYWGGSIVQTGAFFKVRFDNPFSYSDQFDDPPDGYERVLIPYVELVGAWDFRKNALDQPDSVRPHKGVYLALQTQFADFGGDSKDVRLRPEVRFYVPMTSKTTLALRWVGGFLFPFGDTVLADRPSEEVALARYTQLLSFRGFYSGGPDSNRGYGYRGVGPYEILPYLSQNGQSDERAPTGGFGLWELSAELRVPVGEKVNTVFFVDSSDVVARLSDFRVNLPHISPGVGLRYFSPVGPLRFDIGVRVPYLQKLGAAVLPVEEGGPGPGETDDFPVCVSLAIGEAY